MQTEYKYSVEFSTVKLESVPIILVSNSFCSLFTKVLMYNVVSSTNGDTIVVEIFTCVEFKLVFQYEAFTGVGAINVTAGSFVSI